LEEGNQDTRYYHPRYVQQQIPAAPDQPACLPYRWRQAGDLSPPSPQPLQTKL